MRLDGDGGDFECHQHLEAGRYDPMMLDDRKAAILSAVVQEYIGTALPVGSGRVASSAHVGVSAATIRNEMSALEEQGYLTQPHTSAGRIPTDKGYRFFVDHLRAIDPVLAKADSSMVSEFFESANSELETMLNRTSDLLSDLTDWTGVVVGPSVEVATIRSVQLVDLSSRVVMVVAVLSNGAIEKRTVETADEVTREIVADAGRRLADVVVGRSIVDLAVDLTPDDDPLVSAAIEAIREAGRNAEVFVGGASRVASAFEAVEQVREVLAILEQQIVVVSLISDVIERGMRVAIGEETGMAPLAECSLVVAPYNVGGEAAGTIGVIGPTRMNYSQALSAVAVVSLRLGQALSEE